MKHLQPKHGRCGMRLSAIFFALLLLIVIPSQSDAKSHIGTVSYKKVPGTSLVINSIFDGIPSSGFTPIEIIITNSTGKDREWTINTTNKTYNTPLAQHGTFTLSCKATSSATHTILVPITAHPSNGNRNINFTIQENTLGRQTKRYYEPSPNQWPCIGISKKNL